MQSYRVKLKLTVWVPIIAQDRKEAEKGARESVWNFFENHEADIDLDEIGEEIDFEID